MLKTQIKVFSAALITVSSMLCHTPAIADDSDLLKQIVTNTGNTTNNTQISNSTTQSTCTTQSMSSIGDNLYCLLVAFNTFALAWVKGDDSDPTSQLQTDLTKYINSSWDAEQSQLDAQNAMLTYYFGSQQLAPAYANDISFATIMDPNKPYLPQSDPSKLAASVQNYVNYAAALNIHHSIPTETNTWNGSAKSQESYRNFYKTISAVQTFDAYILGSYADLKKGQLSLTNQQKTLEQDATSSDWFKQVTTKDDLGQVLRQSLLYTSQIYVLLLQILQTEKQLLAATAMTNSMLVLNAQYSESILLNSALGITR